MRFRGWRSICFVLQLVVKIINDMECRRFAQCTREFAYPSLSSSLEDNNNNYINDPADLVTITMLKILSFIFLCSFVSACLPDKELKYPKVMYYGDSLCAVTFTPGHLATTEVGIVKDCVPGRKITELPRLSNSYELIFLALSSNDVLKGTPLGYFSDHLNKLLTSTDSPVICVLPVIFEKVDSSAYRAEMMNQCTHLIDPQPECGVGPSFLDEIHYTAKDHDGMASCIEAKVKAFYNGSL